MKRKIAILVLLCCVGLSVGNISVCPSILQNESNTVVFAASWHYTTVYGWNGATPPKTTKITYKGKKYTAYLVRVNFQTTEEFQAEYKFKA